MTLIGVIVEGDRLACRYTWRAVDKSTGKPFDMWGLAILHFRDDKWVERWDVEARSEIPA